jgi:hypothetical protein
MAHRKPTHARARATTTWLACFPRASRRRERVHRRTWAFQRMSWSALGGLSSRHGRCRLTFAGEREAQAPATSARRAWVFPALVSAPCRRRAPREEAAGGRPQEPMSGLGCSKRGRSPSAATGGTATVHGTPRRACSASTTGLRRQDWPCSWRACSRRCSRSVCSLTARTYAWNTMCCAGVGQTTAESHRR